MNIRILTISPGHAIGKGAAPDNTLYPTGEAIPRNGTYRTICAGHVNQQALIAGQKFPNCHLCQAPAMWIQT